MATGSDAVPELSTVRVRTGTIGHRKGMGSIGWWKWLASALRLCYEKVTKGVWRMHIDCARIS